MNEFGVIYDKWQLESTLCDQGRVTQGIECLKQSGYVFEQDGAVWFRATQFGDQKDRVLIRENAETTYFASDVAYHLYKYQQGFDQIIDVLGADHHGYTPRVKAVLEGLGQDPGKLKVALIQFVALYRQGKKIPMSTRSGQFITLRALRQEVGNDAARYFYIMRKSEQHLEFDLELAKARSSENPVYYIQYAHARICSVWEALGRSDNLAWNQEEGVAALVLLTQQREHELMHALGEYPGVIIQAAQHHEPYAVAHFLYALAGLFHRYYNHVTFLVSEKSLRDARLCLLAAIQHVLSNGLGLLGLSAPRAM